MTSNRTTLQSPRILEHQPLKPYTTFKIGGPARYLTDIRTQADLEQALEFAQSQNSPVFVLGGGSNVLVSDEGLKALVLHPVSEGVTLLGEDDEQVRICAEAGEPWDRLVACAVEHNWWGIENLSHIPGQAGAALVQNVGAYGQQLSDVFGSAEVADLTMGKLEVLSREDCGLAYRRSIFNTTHKGRYLILRITLQLSKRPRPNLGYADVKEWFENRGIEIPSQAEIRQAIIAIRDRKFPYPREEKGGNAGSFFKNLILDNEEYGNLERRFQTAFSAPQVERLRGLRARFSDKYAIKMPAAFLIEACGLKGARSGGAQLNERQPLVILNQGGATAGDVLSLARYVRQTLYARLGVRISIEPELVGFSPEELEQFLAFERPAGPI